MSGVHGQLLGQLVRRSADFVMKPAVDGHMDSYKEGLERQAQLYEDSKFKDVQPVEVLTIFFTCVLFMLAYASIKYTLGEVVASLAMIEQPRTTVISEARPVNEHDDPDAPIEKDRLLDEEVVILQEKPLTSSIISTVRHLARVGGYTARWRGLVIATVYHVLQAMLAHLLSIVFSLLPGLQIISFILASVVSTVLLARIHMTWTHIMISTPSPLPWYRRVPRGRTYFRALVTPALIFAIAQHLTVILPLMMFVSFGPLPSPTSDGQNQVDASNEAVRLLTTLATAAFVALALLLPATVTLTRVEASLLPDDAETIVPFDRTLGGAAANLVGFEKINFRALYDAAWRSFDRASRLRLIKFYVKYFAIMMALWMAFVVLVAGEIIYFGGQRMLVFVQSGAAQVQLASLQS